MPEETVSAAPPLTPWLAPCDSPVLDETLSELPVDAPQLELDPLDWEVESLVLVDDPLSAELPWFWLSEPDQVCEALTPTEPTPGIPAEALAPT